MEAPQHLERGGLQDGSSGVDVARTIFERWGVLSIFASGQIMEARQARDIALGYIGKPYMPETVLRSIEVVREIMSGGKPTSVPVGLSCSAQLNSSLRRGPRPRQRLDGCTRADLHLRRAR
jgi:hypothetical protein